MRAGGSGRRGRRAAAVASAAAVVGLLLATAPTAPAATTSTATPATTTSTNPAAASHPTSTQPAAPTDPATEAPVAPHAAAVACANWRYGPADEPASLPPEFDRNDYKDTSLRDPRPDLTTSPQNQCGQKGSAVDLAWGLSRGTPDVVIAILDSGIRWRDAGVMADLATKVHLNLGE